jgi:hypothetical protein
MLEPVILLQAAGGVTINTIAMNYTNEATWDRTLRIVLGVVMLYLGWFALGDGLAAAVFKIFGFLPLITGLLGWCPFYSLLGLATKKIRRPH